MAIDLYAEFLAVCRLLNDNGIPYVVVGGIAVSLLTRPRATEDMDFLISAQDWPGVARIIPEIGYEPHNTLMTLKTVTIGRAIKFDGPEVIVADFLLNNPDDPQTLMDCASTEIDGTIVRLASPSTLIALKKRRGSAQDLADIEQLERLL